PHLDEPPAPDRLRAGPGADRRGVAGVRGVGGDDGRGRDPRPGAAGVRVAHAGFGRVLPQETAAATHPLSRTPAARPFPVGAEDSRFLVSEFDSAEKNVLDFRRRPTPPPPRPEEPGCHPTWSTPVPCPPPRTTGRGPPWTSSTVCCRPRR